MNFNKLIIVILFTAGTTQSEAPDKEATEPGFELVNKANEPIWFSLANGKTIDIPVKRLDSGAGYTARMGRILTPLREKLTEGSEVIDISKPTRLFIWLADPGKVNYGEKWWTIDESVPRLKPQPDYIYTFAPGKTIYINWDKNKFVRPQKGPLGGWMGQTDSGWTLKNNITDSPNEIILKYPRKK